MQTDSSPSYVNGTTNNDDRRNLSPISSQDSSSVLYHPNSSLPTSSLISLMSSTPSDCASTENRGLYMARLALEYQQLVDRHGLCLAHLEEAVKEAEILREENSNLRIVNKDLTKRLSLLTTHHQTPLSSPAAAAASFPSLSIINDFRSLCVGGGDSGGGRRSQSRSTSPIAAASHGFDDQRRRSGGERDSLPKSISIRSSGYLKMNTSSSSSSLSASKNNNNNNNVSYGVRLRSPRSPVIADGTQRVFVPGESKEECAVEFDVYNQGMFKTELCNKWQETGACPYGDHCQFAHGIGELRPVIRHPRYKTDLCRMLLSGHNCPYGHRCHFRHALTHQDRFIKHGSSS